MKHSRPIAFLLAAAAFLLIVIPVAVDLNFIVKTLKGSVEIGAAMIVAILVMIPLFLFVIRGALDTATKKPDCATPDSMSLFYDLDESDQNMLRSRVMEPAHASTKLGNMASSNLVEQVEATEDLMHGALLELLQRKQARKKGKNRK
jgi:hypothetical protein